MKEDVLNKNKSFSLIHSIFLLLTIVSISWKKVMYFLFVTLYNDEKILQWFSSNVWQTKEEEIQELIMLVLI